MRWSALPPSTWALRPALRSEGTTPWLDGCVGSDAAGAVARSSHAESLAVQTAAYAALCCMAPHTVLAASNTPAAAQQRSPAEE